MTRWLTLFIVAVACAAGCAASRSPQSGSQTHFLAQCDRDCPAPFSCLCGACTLACEDDRACGEESALARCASPVDEACGDAPRVCDVGCMADRDCGSLGAGFTCERSRCRGPEPMSGGGTGGSAGTAGAAGAGGSAGMAGAGGFTPPAHCALPAEAGPCDALFPRYFFGMARGRCEAFTYGGCEGNANNFETLAACEMACTGTTLCSLPADSGPCRAAIPRWFHNADTGACEPFTYGGCEGNANNFESLRACQTACAGGSELRAACEVSGVVYASGSDGIPDPQSCNLCICDDGMLACDEAFCPEPCPSGTRYGTTCTSCSGPEDWCEVVRHDCLPTCAGDDECQSVGLGSCMEGVCRVLCG
jgi:hypothetical protein